MKNHLTQGTDFHPNPSSISHSAPTSENAATTIGYYRLDFEFTGGMEDDQPQREPVLCPGRARLVNPAPGTFVRGTLVDYPEMESGIGCVVVDAGDEIVAVQSMALCQLVIEHAPCWLEFVVVELQDNAGKSYWDWEAYELSPNGARVLVSDTPANHRPVAE